MNRTWKNKTSHTVLPFAKIDRLHLRNSKFECRRLIGKDFIYLDTREMILRQRKFFGLCAMIEGYISLSRYFIRIGVQCVSLYCAS